MASQRPEREAYEGLAQVAHAIRRSTALTVAVQVVPPDATIPDLLDMAEHLAGWIGGKALAREQEGDPGQSTPLGRAWPPED